MRHWRVNIVFGPNTRWNDNSGVQTKVKPSFIWSFFCLLICYFCSLILCVIIIVIFIYWFVLTIINSWGWPLWQSGIQRLLLYLYYIRYTFIVIYCYFLTTYGKAWCPVIRWSDHWQKTNFWGSDGQICVKTPKNWGVQHIKRFLFV